MNTLQTISAAVAAIGAIGTGAFTIDSRYTPQDDFYRHLADSRTGTILELVGRANGASGDYRDTLCKALVQELNAVCLDSPDHPMCVDRGEYLKQAGC